MTQGAFQAKNTTETRGMVPHQPMSEGHSHPSRTIVHAKLEMTEPNDHDEQEADAVAETIAEGGKISRKISGGSSSSGITVSNQMENQLNHLQGGGQAMPTGLRNMMESGFGQDFSHVRIHTDSEAATLSSSIHAKAFTYGNDIYFNQGQFSPNTSEGQRLMAHELTHVVQGGGVKRYPRDVLASNAVRKGGGEDPTKIAADLAKILAKKIAKSTGELAQSVQNNWGLVPFVVLNPIDAYKIGRAKSGEKNISTTASNFQQNLCIKNDGPFSCYEYGDEGNAFRHTLWQSIITTQLGADTAKQAGDAHENYNGLKNYFVYSSIEDADRQCDLRNNEIGRNIALNHPNLNNNELAEMVVFYFYENGLWQIEKGLDGYRIIQRKITDEQYKNAIKIIRSKNEFGLSNKSDNVDNKSLKREPNDKKVPDKKIPDKDYSYIFEIKPDETEKIKALKTRKERALFLFGDKAEDALAKKRIYNTIEEAEADMKSVKLDVVGREGKDVTIEMRVHNKLAEYVKEMFAEIKRAYSAPDNEEVFLFDEKDRDRGGFNWRYMRDDIADNQRMIGIHQAKINGLGLDSSVLREVEKIAALSDGQRSKKAKELKKNYKTGTKSIDTEFNKKIDDAITAYRNINKYKGYNAEIEKRTNKLNAENEQFRTEIDELKAKREELGKKYEERHHKKQTIEGIRDDKRLSSSLQAEMELINSESEDRRENLTQLLQEKQSLFDEYERIQVIRNSGSQADIKKEREKLKKRKDQTGLDLLYKSSDTLQSDMDGLREEIDLLDSLVNSDLDEDREKALARWQGKISQQVGLEEEISKDFYSVKTVVKDGLSTEQKVLKKKTVSDALKKEDENAIKRKIDKIDEKIKTIEGKIKENNDKMPEYIKTRFSEHSAGVAIDINPNTNPFYDAPNLFWKGEADKEENAKYFKPSKELKTLEEWRDFHRDKDQYAIKPDSKLVKIFRDYGWNWGGGWSGKRDYMHFEWFSKTWPKE